MNNLNPQQNEAAEHTEGPLLILAGAGAGKTKTITHRIANLIKKGVAPRNILAVTFTNKAATEMRERVDTLLKEDGAMKQPIEVAGRPTIRTFHSLGVLILRENFEKMGLSKRFSILDRGDSKKIIRDVLKADGYDPKQYDPGKIMGIISREKGEMVTPDEYSDNSSNSNYMADVVTAAWRGYEKKLKEQDVLDFDDLLVRSAKLLRDDPVVLKKYQQRWQYVHVDEYQDTNKVQYQMTKMLADEHHNICVVGDVDQNIYSWRGATIENIMNFEQDYPEAKQVTLEENYRSTQNILKAANDVISKNKKRREKKLFTKNSDGDKIFIYQGIDEYDEATFSVLKAKEMIANGSSPDEIVMLYRANFQSRVLEEVCLRNNLPHQVIGTKFFDRKEVRDIIAYIKAALNEKDFTSLNRIINTPVRGIGKATIERVLAGEEDKLTPAMQDRVNKFRTFLKKIRDAVTSEDPDVAQKPHEIIAMILSESTLEAKLQKEGDEGLERIENIKELSSLAKKYEGMSSTEAMDAFLENVSLSSDQDQLDEKTEKRSGEGVKLMTVHAAKGLEFDHVFVTGLEANLFPHVVENSKKDDDEEERRLFYVAITRARKKLFLTWASFRTIYGTKQVNMASEFLDDISDEISEGGNFGNGGMGEGDSPKSSGGVSEYLIDF